MTRHGCPPGISFVQKDVNPSPTAYENHAPREGERLNIDLLHTIHEDSTVRAMERRGIATERGEFNRWIKATNAVIRDTRKKIAALAEWLKEVKGEPSKPKAPNLISLLQAYYDRRNAGAYSQKASINNLEEMNALFNSLMENGIHDLDTLKNRVNALRNDKQLSGCYCHALSAS